MCSTSCLQFDASSELDPLVLVASPDVPDQQVDSPAGLVGGGQAKPANTTYDCNEQNSASNKGQANYFLVCKQFSFDIKAFNPN